MYEAGTILYFTPYYFKNGKSEPKNKYFVILKNINDAYILASLPTRKDHIPQKDLVARGCIELPEIDLNCFIISKAEFVTTCSKKFDFTTHIYGKQINTENIDYLKNNYPTENENYEVWGKMKKRLFEELINCLKNSDAISKKYAKLLNE